MTTDRTPPLPGPAPGRRLLGLDVGSKTIGVAVSDDTGTIARGVTTIRRGTLARDLQALRTLVVDLGAGGIVVGLPVNMNGTIGPSARAVLTFVERLRGAMPVPLEMWDERWTTQAAERALREARMSRRRRAQRVHATAAVLLLQTYLDRQRGARASVEARR